MRVEDGKRDWGRVAGSEEFPACGMTLTVGIALCSTAWVQKIKAASEQYIETEKKKREKAYQGTYRVLCFLLICLDTWAGPFLEDATVSVQGLPLQIYRQFFTVATKPFLSDFFVPSSLTENLRNRTLDGSCD